MKNNNVIVLDPLTSGLFKLDKDITEEMELDWLREETRIVVDHLTGLGYNFVSRHGFSLMFKAKDSLDLGIQYGIWIEDPEKTHYGIWRVDKLVTYERDPFYKLFHTRNREYLDTFLREISDGIWENKVIEKVKRKKYKIRTDAAPWGVQLQDR